MAGIKNAHAAPSGDSITGVVLAAGAGHRAGGPKALRRTEEGEPWIARAVEFLVECGCSPIIVVLGASAAAARPLVPEHATVVVNELWQQGMSGSVRVGLDAATGVAALVTLVDLPDLPASVGTRVLELPVKRDALRQAVFDGRPGHPVLIGSDHWAAVAADLTGDRGARHYLERNTVVEIECGDLADGSDVDR